MFLLQKYPVEIIILKIERNGIRDCFRSIFQVGIACLHWKISIRAQIQTTDTNKNYDSIWQHNRHTPIPEENEKHLSVFKYLKFIGSYQYITEYYKSTLAMEEDIIVYKKQVLSTAGHKVRNYNVNTPTLLWLLNTTGISLQPWCYVSQTSVYHYQYFLSIMALLYVPPSL